MIRNFQPEDAGHLERIHLENNLPDACLPKFDDPLFLHKAVLEHDGKIVMASFLRATSEIFVLVDHEAATPEERWRWLQEIKDHMATRAYQMGYDSISCWVPTDLEKSFGPRLEELGFRRSPWQSYTLLI